MQPSRVWLMLHGQHGTTARGQFMRKSKVECKAKDDAQGQHRETQIISAPTAALRAGFVTVAGSGGTTYLEAPVQMARS